MDSKEEEKQIVPDKPETIEEKKDFTQLNQNIDPIVREKYKQHYSKVKVAIFFGYNGKNYHGLQKNENVETIEGVLEQALYHADFIPPYNFDKLYKIGWGRGGRTDKGVHAVCNVINVKLCVHNDYLINDYQDQMEEAKKNSKHLNTVKKEFNWNAIIAKINENLPGQIKVLAIKKVTAKFNVRKMARSRIYEYFCPITIFREMSPGLIEELKKNIKELAGLNKEASKELNSKIESMIIKDHDSRKYEYTQEEDEKLLERINELCQQYIGTKNFHNYTVKLKWNDPSAKRYMLSIQTKLVNPYEMLEKFPKLDEKVEKILESTNEKKLPQFLLFRIHGQSFMYHQIRKMIGMVVQMIQENLSLSYMQNSFYGNTYNVWLGAPEGLLMNRITFEGYNYKQIPEKIEFTQEEEDQMQKFKEEMIYSQIIEDEFFNYKFSLWLGKQLSQCTAMELEENDQEIHGDDD